MRTDNPQAVYLQDYQPPKYWIDSVDLEFSLAPNTTTVTSRLVIRSNETTGTHSEALVLQGEGLKLRAIELNDRPLLLEDEYSVNEHELTILLPPKHFQLMIRTEIDPKNNTSLEGLYMSNGRYCTQCEAHGFRKMTYYLDRPDVMARFTTTVIADKTSCPILLSNGNKIDSGELEGNKHWVKWEDPFRKPAYLFALVAGQLACHRDTFTTLSGRKVALELFVEEQHLAKCTHAMQALQQAMQWDEEVYGLEYDLDTYMIVAVNDFNMGAMENKGLNLFNAKYILADQATATDHDFLGISTVVAHEYFHNWTGNRVTLRDWFQLSLKEGLTVFRDQEFTADISSRPVRRIEDVSIIRRVQFEEDAGPTAHPVRPDSYIEMNNFYTVTVYNKGAEVIRMMHTLLGAKGFRQGMDLYFARHDGMAVTCDDFVQAMEEATHHDLTQFRLWYSQAGTPVVQVEWQYDESQQTLTLHTQQDCPATPGQAEKKPFHIPMPLALFDQQGQPMPLHGEKSLDGSTEAILNLTEAQHRFTLTQVRQRPVPSLFRNFSAPVKVEAKYQTEELVHLLRYDTDPINRWNAQQQLATQTLLQLVAQSQAQDTLALLPQQDLWIEVLADMLTDPKLDKAFLAYCCQLPEAPLLARHLPVFDIDAITAARTFLRRQLGLRLQQSLGALYEQLDQGQDYQIDAEAMAQRALRNLSLKLLTFANPEQGLERCAQQFNSANNMTDSLAALSTVVHFAHKTKDELLDKFYQRWSQEPLVVNKWLSVQAVSELAGTGAQVQKLLEHQAFDIRNPNNVYALLVCFGKQNLAQFHAADGQGYTLLGEQVRRLNDINPQVAARLVSAFFTWRQFAPSRATQMQQELEKIQQHHGLSRDVYELVNKALAG